MFRNMMDRMISDIIFNYIWNQAVIHIHNRLYECGRHRNKEREIRFELGLVVLFAIGSVFLSLSLWQMCVAPYAVANSIAMRSICTTVHRRTACLGCVVRV